MQYDDPIVLSEAKEKFNNMVSLSKLVEILKSQMGTKTSPATSCKDLFLNHPTFESATYWIDPNQGSIEDAFEAQCNKEDASTCIYPTESTISKGTWYTGEPKMTWFSKMGGPQIKYDVSVPQLQFLQIMSTKATQTITYLCKNTVAFQDDENLTTHAITFATSDDEELGPTSRNTYTVSLDECKSRPSTWGKTVFEFSTPKTTRLPVEDFAPSDIGAEGQGFGMEVGPVCFH